MKLENGVSYQVTFESDSKGRLKRTVEKFFNPEKVNSYSVNPEIKSINSIFLDSDSDTSSSGETSESWRYKKSKFDNLDRSCSTRSYPEQAETNSWTALNTSPMQDQVSKKFDPNYKLKNWEEEVKDLGELTQKDKTLRDLSADIRITQKIKSFFGWTETPEKCPGSEISLYSKVDLKDKKCEIFGDFGFVNSEDIVKFSVKGLSCITGIDVGDVSCETTISKKLIAEISPFSIVETTKIVLKSLLLKKLNPLKRPVGSPSFLKELDKHENGGVSLKRSLVETKFPCAEQLEIITLKEFKFEVKFNTSFDFETIKTLQQFDKIALQQFDKIASNLTKEEAELLRIILEKSCDTFVEINKSTGVKGIGYTKIESVDPEKLIQLERAIKNNYLDGVDKYLDANLISNEALSINFDCIHLGTEIISALSQIL